MNSRGPNTERGKAASSRNAVRRGILSETVVLEGESVDRFIEHLAALQEYFEPANPIQSALVETLAVCRWRQMRLSFEIQKQSLESNDDSTTSAKKVFFAKRTEELIENTGHARGARTSACRVDTRVDACGLP
jgi:hypothetical protein